jgi:glycosyltransferase involved in cell wall biosynthesis
LLAILSTHPILYQVPIWRGLAARGDIPMRVYYLSKHGIDASFDPGFGHSFAWDLDLLAGYAHEFLDAEVGPRQDSFRWLSLRHGFGEKLRRDGVSILWVQGWQVRAYWQAIREAQRAGIRVWLRGESNLRSSGSPLRQLFKRLPLKRLLNRVDRFLAIGRANRQFYLQLGYPAERVASAPYCVENKRFAEQADAARVDRARLRRDWGIDEDAFCFLSVGKFIPKKRPMDIVRAVARLSAQRPGSKLHILWVGSGELGAELRGACDLRFDADGAGACSPAADSGRPRASFAGFLNQSEIAKAYVAADALVLPSDAKETWGLVVNEAMASGLPCVVSDQPGSADDLIVPHRPDLCFPMGDIESMARSLSAVIADPPTGAQLREWIADYDVQRTVYRVAAL